MQQAPSRSSNLATSFFGDMLSSPSQWGKSFLFARILGLFRGGGNPGSESSLEDEANLEHDMLPGSGFSFSLD